MFRLADPRPTLNEELPCFNALGRERHHGRPTLLPGRSNAVTVRLSENFAISLSRLCQTPDFVP